MHALKSYSGRFYFNGRGYVVGHYGQLRKVYQRWFTGSGH